MSKIKYEMSGVGRKADEIICPRPVSFHTIRTILRSPISVSLEIPSAQLNNSDLCTPYDDVPRNP
jgi:hypothetical protein